MADPLLELLGAGGGGPQLAPPIQRDIGQGAQAVDPLLSLVGVNAPGAPAAPAAEGGGSGGLLADAWNSVKADVSNIPKRLGNIAAGAVREAGGIGATLLAPYDMAKDAIDGKGLSLDSNRQRRRDMDSYMDDAGFDRNSVQYGAGRLIGGLTGTAGVGTVLAAPVRAIGAASSIPQIARLADITASGLGSGGFNVAGAKGAAGLAARMGTGAATGAAAVGMVNPEDAGTGALIGTLLPPVVQGVGKVGRGVIRAATPKQVLVAEQLADKLGITPGDMTAATTGPQMIPGYQPTVPQILQTPDASQLQRTLKTAGATAIGDAERQQQTQLRAALERIAPIDNTVQDAAERTGNAIQDFGMPARQQATKQVSAEFDAVDPFNESKLILPLDKMQGAVDKYLGPGTFGTGARARQAMEAATEAGTETVPAIKPIPQSVGTPQTLEQAVRKQGGIHPDDPVFGGEINDLRPRESGTTGLYSQYGRSAEDMAQTMHERGFIPDADPATLIAALRNGGGRKIIANDVPEDTMRRMYESAMGDAPTGPTTYPRVVPFQTIQNLRSSLGEAAEQAAAKQSNKEAAALRQMVGEIDGRLNAAAAGRLGPDEFFDQAMVDQYRKALAAHATKMNQFELGPQIGMFRKGADGQPTIQGAEIAGKFYNGNRSQVEDMQAFKRLVGNRDDLMQEMKRYAMTQGFNTSTAKDELSTKFINWMQARSGANRELFSPQERATIGEVGKAVQRQFNAENIGRVSGPDTAQKLHSLQSNGMLDSKAVDFLVDKAAGQVPLAGTVGKGVFNNFKAGASAKKQQIMAGLLADPQQLEEALRRVPGMFSFDPNRLVLRSGAHRVAPLMLSGD